MHRKNKVGSMLRCVSILCICAALALGAMSLCGMYRQQRQTDRVSQQVQAQFYTAQATLLSTEAPYALGTVSAPASGEVAYAETKAVPTTASAQMATAAPEYSAVTEVPTLEPTPEPELQAAFEGLYQQNSDIVGWLKVSDSVDEPVLYRDIEYYTHHDFYGNESQSGAIFLDPKNSIYMLEDDMLILYGHNMRDGSMFGDLDFFRDDEYLAKYPIISLQSAYEAEPRQYAIFAYFDASMEKENEAYFKVRKASFDSVEEEQAYLDTILARSFIESPLEVTVDDQLLQLVTCSYSNDNGRLLVFARLLREDETAETVTPLYAQWAKQ